MATRRSESQIAQDLAELYEQSFAGKDRGRYRVSMKHMRALTGRRRVTREVVQKISEELFELGFVLVDLETYFVVLAQRTFSSYRRVSDTTIAQLTGSGTRH